MDALLALVRKDLVLYFSNKRALAITLAAPILIAAFFGSVMGGRRRSRRACRWPSSTWTQRGLEGDRRLDARRRSLRPAGVAEPESDGAACARARCAPPR
jgi:hypothetical protein